MARLVIAVGGSIAAYKACDLTSKAVQAGHRVDIVLTRSAQKFVQPLAFSALTHRTVFTDASIFGTNDEGGPANHLRVTEKADVFVVAPCTANLMGKFAHGIADDLVSTTYLGASCPVLLAPAMNTRMWNHKRVQANLKILKNDDVQFIGPERGYLAEAEEGVGRMSEPADILKAIEHLVSEE